MNTGGPHLGWHYYTQDKPNKTYKKNKNWGAAATQTHPKMRKPIKNYEETMENIENYMKTV